MFFSILYYLPEQECYPFKIREEYKCLVVMNGLGLTIPKEIKNKIYTTPI